MLELADAQADFRREILVHHRLPAIPEDLKDSAQSCNMFAAPIQQAGVEQVPIFRAAGGHHRSWSVEVYGAARTRSAPDRGIESRIGTAAMRPKERKQMHKVWT